jgi:hypothetical protein
MLIQKINIKPLLMYVVVEVVQKEQKLIIQLKFIIKLKNRVIIIIILLIH